jgi:hypothetical protein
MASIFLSGRNDQVILVEGSLFFVPLTQKVGTMWGQKSIFEMA